MDLYDDPAILQRNFDWNSGQRSLRFCSRSEKNNTLKFTLRFSDGYDSTLYWRLTTGVGEQFSLNFNFDLNFFELRTSGSTCVTRKEYKIEGLKYILIQGTEGVESINIQPDLAQEEQESWVIETDSH
jgi:hypothetical protein